MVSKLFLRPGRIRYSRNLNLKKKIFFIEGHNYAYANQQMQLLLCITCVLMFVVPCLHFCIPVCGFLGISPLN